MSTVGIIPTASLMAANQALKAQGFGPDNFSVPAWSGPAPTFAAFHAWTDPVFEAAVKLISGATIVQSNGDPIADTLALIQAQGAQWGAQAPALPVGGDYPGNTHPVTANTLYLWTDGTMWWVIQAHDRAVYGGNPNQYPALIRKVRDPNVVSAWKQPLDQYDAYKLLNPFTGKPDECTYNGKSWVTTVDVNVWEPGAVNGGWADKATGQVPAPPPVEWPQWVQPTGAQDAYALGAQVTFQTKHYISLIAANVWSPTAYPAGWQVQA